MRVSLLSELYHAEHSSSDTSCGMFSHHNQWLLQDSGIRNTSVKTQKHNSCYCWLSTSEFKKKTDTPCVTPGDRTKEVMDSNILVHTAEYSALLSNSSSFRLFFFIYFKSKEKIVPFMQQYNHQDIWITNPMIKRSDLLL